MKHLRKIVSIFLTAIMVLAMCIPVMADASSIRTYTLTINKAGQGHTYEVYQIFRGVLSESEGNKILSDISWGAGIDTDKISSFTYGNKSTAEEIANYLSNKSETEGKAFATEVNKVLGTVTATAKTLEGETAVVISGLQAGYYLIKDVNVPEQSAYTEVLLKVVGDAEVDTKMDVPTVEKKVKENVKEINEEGHDTDTRIPSYSIPSKYNDVADYCIGDHVPFQLIGTMPSNIDDYKLYSYKFVDTLSKGLTYDGNAVVKIDGTKVDGITPEVQTDTATGITTITITFADIKNVSNTIKIDGETKVVVDYTATLNANANIGLNGNENIVYLNFSNNPNGTGIGKTKEDKVIVFTYELETKKVDGKNTDKTLSGAKFKLLSSDQLKGAKVNENGIFEEWVDISNATELVTGQKGVIEIKGLDDGTYYIKEIEAPEGYNKLKENVKVTISASTNNGQNWSGNNAISAISVKYKMSSSDTKDVDGSSSLPDGKVTVTIANNQGSTLPETGGIGTTIFYIVGVVLVLGAGVLLVTKKRMNADK